MIWSHFQTLHVYNPRSPWLFFYNNSLLRPPACIGDLASVKTMSTCYVKLFLYIMCTVAYTLQNMFTLLTANTACLVILIL